MKSAFTFARTRRFAPLFGTQFLGAFNDNLFKTTLFVLIGFYGLGKNPILPTAQLLNLGALLFVLPYFLFSALAGQLATRFDKARLAQCTKILEIGIMALACYGFIYQSAVILLLCLFLMGTQSTLFGPVKYAVLPEYLSKSELLMGNGLIESGTFLAILFGQIMGSAIAGQNPIWLASSVVLVAVLGWVCSMLMPPAATLRTSVPCDKNIVRSTRLLLQQTFRQPELCSAILGISWFWFVGSVYTTQLLTFVQIHLHGDASVYNLILGLFSIGIAIGSVCCAKISRGTLRLWLVVVGALGLSALGSLLVYNAHHLVLGSSDIRGIGAFLAHSSSYPIAATMIGIGFFGGFFSVPLYTWLQTASSDEFRPQAIAANNIINAIFMVSAAIISAILLAIFNSILLLYSVVALGNILFLLYLSLRAPQIWSRQCK